MPTLKAEYEYARKKELNDPAAAEKLQEKVFLYNKIVLKGLCKALRFNGYNELADGIEEKGESLSIAVEPTKEKTGGDSLGRWKKTRNEAAGLMDLLKENEEVIKQVYVHSPHRVAEIFEKTADIMDKAGLSKAPKLPAYKAPSKKDKYGLSNEELADAFQKHIWISRLTDEVIMDIDTSDPDQVKNCIDQYRLCKTALYIVEESKDLPESEKTPEKFIDRLEKGLKDPWIQNPLNLEYTPECCEKCCKDSVRLNNHFFMVEVREMLEQQNAMEKASAKKQDTAEYSGGDSDEYEGSESEDEMDGTEAGTDEPENEKTIVPSDQLVSEALFGDIDNGIESGVSVAADAFAKQQLKEASVISADITDRNTIGAVGTRPELPEDLKDADNDIRRGSTLNELGESESHRLHELYRNNENLKEGLEAKHITGLFSGSTGSHQKMLDAFNEMQKSVVGSQGDSLGADERQKRLESLVIAKKAAEDYIADKKAHGWGDTSRSDWRPLTRMGKKRYEAALAIIEAVDQELEAEAKAVKLHDEFVAADSSSAQETETTNDKAIGDTEHELSVGDTISEKTAEDHPSNTPANFDPAFYAEKFDGLAGYLDSPENSWEDVRYYVTFHAAAVIVTKDLELLQKKTGEQMPDISQAELDASIKEFMKSDGFKETINEYGGTGWNALKNISASIENDGGKEIHSKYVKNGISAKKQAEKNAEVKDYFINKEKVKEKTIKHDRVMGH